MTKYWIRPAFLSLLIFSSVPVFAENVPPVNVTNLVRSVEKNLPVWKLSSVRPLDEIVKRPFAVAGWKIVFERPRSSEAVAGDPAGRKAKDKYEAVLVLIPVSAGKGREDFSPFLSWEPSPYELFTKTHFLGCDRNWWAFLNADVMTIDIIRNSYGFRGGDSIEETLADALNSPLIDLFSKREVVARIGRYGDKAIPAIRRAIGFALAEKLPISAHYFALKALRTHKANMELIFAVVSSEIPEVTETALNALCSEPYPEEASNIYLQQLESRKRIPECVTALFVLRREKEMLPILRKLVQEPETFQEYFLLASSIDRILTGKTDIPEMHIAGQIRLLLAHSGDVAGTPRIIPISDKTAMRGYQFAEEDYRRVKPLEEQLASSPDKNMAILAALTLVNFDGSRGGTRFTRDYTIRVRNAGMRVLRRLPRKEVRRALNALKLVRSAELAEYFKFIDESLSGRNTLKLPERSIR